MKIELFEESGLDPRILKGIEELGFEKPTDIQAKVIPHILASDKDMVGLAQTGTGKTAAFALPLIQLTNLKKNYIQTLILCPTRELCIQVTKDVKSYTKYWEEIKTVAVYGGANIESQIKDLKKGCQLVVGTPGRVLDLIKRKVLKIQDIKWLVLDEADEMLSMGFRDDLETILSFAPQKRRTFLFSATMPKDLASKFLNDPEEISVGKRNAGAENVNHEYYLVQARNKYLALKRIADINPSIYGIVFCRTRATTKEIADKLIQDGYNADALHGDLSQAQRDHVMHRFRLKNLQILVATDVAARGLDVNNLTHVINYNLPDDDEVYIHRSGRTGRAGKNGTSISILHLREHGKLKQLEKILGKQFHLKKVPGGREICEKQLFKQIDKVEHVEVNEDQIGEFMPVIYKKLEWLDRNELIKHFVSVEFNRFLDYYKTAPDLNVSDREAKRSKPEAKKSSKKKGFEFSRFYLSVGSNGDISPVKIIGLINQYSKIRNIEIGEIDIMRNFSFFEVDKKYEGKLQESFKNVRYQGSAVRVELSNPDPKKPKPGNNRNKRKKRR